MRTTFVMDPPPIVEDWLTERHALGQDLHDEVWEGEYHVAAAPNDAHADVQAQLMEALGPLARQAGLLPRGPSNIGAANDFRVPDLAFLRGTPDPVWQHTAAILVEVVSPGDESRLKFDHYSRAGVDELVIVDPAARTVEWFWRDPDVFVAASGSAILRMTSDQLSAAIDWPD